MGFGEDLARAEENHSAGQWPPESPAERGNRIRREHQALAFDRLFSDSVRPAAGHLAAAGVPVQVLSTAEGDSPIERVPGGGWVGLHLAISTAGGLYIDPITQTRAARRPPRNAMSEVRIKGRWNPSRAREVFEHQGDRGIRPGETVTAVRPFRGDSGAIEFLTPQSAALFGIEPSTVQDPGEFFLRTERGETYSEWFHIPLRDLIAKEVLALTRAHRR